MYDHHNGKTVAEVGPNFIILEDGHKLDILSVAPEELVGTKLLKVVQDDSENSDGIAYLHFGTPPPIGLDGKPVGQPHTVGIVEATGDDLRGENA